MKTLLDESSKKNVVKNDHVFKITFTLISSYSVVRMIDFDMLAVGVFPGKVKKSVKAAKNRLLFDVIKHCCTTSHSTRNHRYLYLNRLSLLALSSWKFEITD